MNKVIIIIIIVFPMVLLAINKTSSFALPITRFLRDLGDFFFFPS